MYITSNLLETHFSGVDKDLQGGVSSENSERNVAEALAKLLEWLLLCCMFTNIVFSGAAYYTYKLLKS